MLQNRVKKITQDKPYLSFHASEKAEEKPRVGWHFTGFMVWVCEPSSYPLSTDPKMRSY
jgi:hypothetical protein